MPGSEEDDDEDDDEVEDGDVEGCEVPQRSFW